MKTRALFLLFFVISFVSCSESAEDLIADNGEKAKTQFDQFYKCYEIAKTEPVVSKDAINWEENDANVDYGSANVYQIGIESFCDLALPLDIAFDGTRRREHADMAKLFEVDLSAHEQPHDYEVDPKYSYHKIESGESCTKAIRHFLDAKYLLINRISIQAEPVQMNEESFLMGYVAGDVLVFDISNAKLLGGFVVEAESNDYIQIPETSDLKANLDASLSQKAYRTTIEKFAALTPSVTDISFDF